MPCGVEAAGDYPGGKTSVCGTYFMCACGKPFAEKNDNTRFHPCEGCRKLDEVNIAVEAALFNRLIFPCNTKEVKRIDIPQPDILQAGFDFIRNQVRISLLSEGGKDDPPFPETVDSIFKRRLTGNFINWLDHNIRFFAINQICKLTIMQIKTGILRHTCSRFSAAVSRTDISAAWRK